MVAFGRGENVLKDPGEIHGSEFSGQGTRLPSSAQLINISIGRQSAGEQNRNTVSPAGRAAGPFVEAGTYAERQRAIVLPGPAPSTSRAGPAVLLRSGAVARATASRRARSI